MPMNETEISSSSYNFLPLNEVFDKLNKKFNLFKIEKEYRRSVTIL